MRRRSHSLILLLLAALAGAFPGAAQEPDLDLAAEAARPAPNQVLPGIWKLDGIDPDLAYTDLEPLRQVIGKATIVGLGESVHTSGGYYETKHRLFRFLVEKMGFRVFAIENPWLAVENTNAYLQTDCSGSPDAATTGFFGVWRSTELRDLVVWMCEWNRSHPKPKDKLSFYGFDIQWQAAQDAEALTAFLARIGADDPRATGFARCGEVQTVFQATENVPQAAHSACKGAADAAAEIFRNERAIVRQTSKQDFEWAKVRLVGLQAWLEEMFYYESDIVRSVEARDAAMAYVFGAIRALRFPKAKIAVWAHNFHIAKEGPEGYGVATMGTYLGRTYKKAYTNVALISHETSIDWIGLGCGLADPPGAGSVEELLNGLGHEYLLVDLDFPGGRPPFLTPGRVYPFGWDPIVPRRHYDALVYLKASRKMTPINWVPCQ